MGRSDRRPAHGKETAEDEHPHIKGYSSPACMMHELDPAFMEHAETLPAAGSAQDWDEVRLWRKVERAAQSEAIKAALLPALSSHPGALICFYWLFNGEYNLRVLVRLLRA